ncbi:MAG: NAD-dependent epimerase/dehydratase family protein [Gammaproteobacteria bacterium]|nr:NAD-dependent epimerase/dehydratase family protein [Gammaproteobacteria bacterium]MCH9744360.1 NAD-dependent epimerase/dehydratase family protein [Gammaproteobacteria bacterium]
MMKFFISGVAGFLGSHLAESFLAEGHQVVGCDNLIGGELANVPTGVEFYQYDCIHRNSMLKITKGCDVVFHCAATAHEGLSVFAPHVITQNTFGASISLFSAAIENKVKRIIYCSSMARYGCNELPFHEALEPKPQDPYGIAKVAAEQVLTNLCHVHGVEFVIAVPHNIIGPRQKYDDPYRNVASIMINLMLQGRQPYIYGDGEQMRCFSFVQDCIYCLKQMAIQDDIKGETINIGPDDEFVTINQLSREIADLLKFDLQPIYVPGRPQEVKHANCSADKARRLLGYETTTNLRDGLQSMIDYIKEKGVRPFQYYLDVEIRNEKLPITWAKRLFLEKNKELV